MSKTIYVVSTRYIGEKHLFQKRYLVDTYYKLGDQNSDVVIYGYYSPAGEVHDLQERLDTYCSRITEPLDDTVQLVFLLHDKDIQSGDRNHFRVRDDRTIIVNGQEKRTCDMKIYGYNHLSSDFFGNFLKKFDSNGSTTEFHERFSQILRLFDMYEQVNECKDRNNLARIVGRQYLNSSDLESDLNMDFSTLKSYITRNLRKEIRSLANNNR